MSVPYATRKAQAKRARQQSDRWLDDYKTAERERRQREHAEQKAKFEAEREADWANSPRDFDTLEPGDYVRDDIKWHRVVRVNAGSVTVATPYSWTDRIDRSKVIETRKRGAA